MLPSAHVLPAVAVAVKTKSKSTWIWLPFLVLLAHLPLDLIPHLEPGLVGGNDYTSPSSFGFWWALADILASAWIAYRVSCVLPGHSAVLFLCLSAGLLPDLVQVWGKFTFLPQPSFLPAYAHVHDGVHIWWKLGWPKTASIAVGTLTTGLLWFFSVRTIHRRCME